MAETAEQIRLRLLATARQRQADAEAADAAETNAAAGLNDPVDGGALKEGVRAFGEDVVGTLDLPTRAANFIRNAPALTTNAGIAAAKNATPEQLKERGVDPAIVNLQPEATVQSPDYNRTIYNSFLPPDPNHPEPRKVGNIAGSVLPAIVAPEALAGEFPSLLPALADTAFTTATTYGGGKGGRLVDQYFGGTGDTGEAVGELFGGGLTPLVSNFASRGLTAPNSVARFNDAKLAGVKEPGLPLVGSNFASRWGSPAKQEIQQSQIDANLRDIGTEIRGSQAPGPISKADVGQQVVNTSKTGAKTAATDADAAYRAGFDQIDQNAPIRSEGPALRRMPPNAEPTFQRPLVEEILDSVEASHLNDAGAGPRYVDPNAQTALEADVTLRQRELDRLAQTGAPTSKVEAAKADLAQAQEALDGNKATTFNDVKVRRGRVQQSLDADQGDRFTLSETQKAQTEAMRQAVLDRGITSDEFDRVNQTYADLKTKQSELEKLAQAKEGPAYNQVFSPASEQSPSTLRTLRDYGDPKSLANILADNFEIKARGAPVAGRPELPRDTGLNPRAPDWWDSAPDEVRQAYASTPAMRERIDATMRTIRADARRGGSQVEGPDIVTPSAAAAAVTGHPLAAAAVMTPRVGSYLFGKLLENPNFTKSMIARRLNPVTPFDLARVMASSVGAQQQSR
jgi:hypothetical protein